MTAKRNNNTVMVKCPVCDRELRSNGLPLHLKAHERKGEIKHENKEPEKTIEPERDISGSVQPTAKNVSGEQIDLVQTNDSEGVYTMDNPTTTDRKNTGNNEETHNIRIIEGAPAPKVPEIVQSGMDKFLDKHGDELIGIAAAVVGTLVQNLTAKNNQTPERQEGMVKDILGNTVPDF